MRIIKTLFLLLYVCIPVLSSAQDYEVDCLVSSEVKAVPMDKPTDYDGTRTVLYFRNGSHVKVVGRKIVGTTGNEASHLGGAGDSIDVRQIKAVIEYEGTNYLIEARWLKFSDRNSSSESDIFASDNFRPRPQSEYWPDLPRLDIHSADARMLYGPVLPILALLLMMVAVWLILRTRFIMISVLPFVGASAIMVYMAVMMDWDALWWCNPDYVGLFKAICGIIPVALFMALALCYFFCVTAFAKGSFVVWPIIVGYLLQWPMIMVASVVIGSVWPAFVVCYGLPMLINGLRSRLYGIVMTAAGIFALYTFIVSLAVTIQISLWILMAMAIAFPGVSFLVFSLFGKYVRAGKQKWVWRDGRAQYVYHSHPTDRSV